MRLVKLAKALGMTGQQLRHELEQVNFGVKPTDREVPDNLAQGIVRFLARKHNLDIDPELFGIEGMEEDGTEELEQEEELESEPDTDGQTELEKAPIEPKQEATPAPVPPKVQSPSADTSPSRDQLNVLRKLTLDNVPKAAVDRQKRTVVTNDDGKILSKKERERIAMEQKAAAAVEKKKTATVSQQQIKKKEGIVLLPDQVTVKEFAEKTGYQVPAVIAELMKNGIMATITQSIDFETAAIIATELGVTVQKEESTVDVEHLHSRNLEELLKDEPETLEPRAPVVVVMGHVDHGKTSILDSIRETDVVAKEAGGITQHIGAYQVLHSTKKEQHPITFLDTPGHEAFTAMRARGAQITDIAIIVVAANEGVKPTTIEAINHAKEAKVPIIVAINKMDIEGADPEKVKGELAGYELQAEDWGGDVPMVPCSAHTKQGITDILDTIVLLAELNEIKANPNRNAIATVIESHVDPSLGSIATLVINTGTLNVGESFICGTSSGKVRAMMDAHGKRLERIGPSGAVRLSGFSDVPQVGDILQVVASDQQAKELIDQFSELEHARKKRSFADLVSRLSEGKITTLKIVLKTDMQGSLEALRDSLAKLATDEVSVKIIHAAIGAVSENDVMMASASDGIVVAFHTNVSPSMIRIAEREGVKIRQYDVVYALLDDIEGLLKGLVEPVEEEQILGHLEVKEIFMTKKKEQIIGGKVTDGVIKRLNIRILRNGEEVGAGRITSLKRVDKDIKEAAEGVECGMKVETACKIESGDSLEVYLQELKKKG